MCMTNPSQPFLNTGAGMARRLLIVLLLSCMLLVLTPAVGAATGGSTVTVTDYQITPSVLLPGEQATIKVVLQNTASVASSTETVVVPGPTGTTTSETKDLVAVFNSVRLFGNGLQVIEGTYDHAGALGPGQSMPLTFLVRAPAQSGMYFPEVWVQIPGGFTVRYPVPVNVNSNLGLPSQAILVMESSLPDSVQPGSEIPVTLTVANAGRLLANDVTVRIETSGTAIAPRNTDLHHLGTIQGGEEQQVNLVLISDRNTASGLTRIPVSIQYTTSDGKNYTQNASINIPFEGQAELGFVSVDTSPRRAVEGQPFDLTIRIENTGTGEAKQVAATVDLPMTGSKEAFIGKIKPGNDAPAIFMLDGADGGTYTYDLTIAYVDDTGAHTVTRTMSVHVLPSEGMGGMLPLLGGFLLVGFVGYRYWYLPRRNASGALPWLKKN